MSLLLEALKALAEKPAPPAGASPPAAGLVTSANQAQPAAVTMPLGPTPPEALLEIAASAVAETLRDTPPASPPAPALHAVTTTVPSKRATAPEVSEPPAAADEENFEWASIWKQAITDPTPIEVVSDEHTSSDELLQSTDADCATPESETPSPFNFAPWFAAHGLMSEPAESAEPTEPVADSPPVSSAAAEIAPAVTTALPAAASDVEPAVTVTAPLPDFSSIESGLSLPVASESRPESTWELYDRSAELATPWKFETALQQTINSYAEPAGATTGETPAEYAPPEPIKPVNASLPEIKLPETNQPEIKLPEATQPEIKLPDFSAPVTPARHVTFPAPFSVAVEPETRSTRAPAPASPAAAPMSHSAAQPTGLMFPSSLPQAEVHAPAPQAGELRVSEPYLRLANRLLQTLRSARPQGIVLGAVDEAAARVVDVAQLAKAITLSEEGSVLVIQAHKARHELGRRLGILPDRHPRWMANGGGELADRIFCSQDLRIDFMPAEKVSVSADGAIDPLLLARCKRHYALVLIDVGVVASEIARSMTPQGDAALLVAVLQHTRREQAVQSTALLRRLGVRTAGCVLVEPRPAA